MDGKIIYAKFGGDSMKTEIKNETHDPLTCPNPACKHQVEEMDDWLMGTCPDSDTATDDKGEMAPRSSGMLVCPECNTETGVSYFAKYTTYNKEGVMAGLSFFIPQDDLDELLDFVESSDFDGSALNIGQAIVNAARADLLARYKTASAIKALFGGKNQYIENHLNKIRRKA